MRRHRPAGANRRSDPTDRRFERRLNDLRADYLRIEASAAFVARIQASLASTVRLQPRRRKVLGALATVALAFLGGFLFAGTPGSGPHHAASAGGARSPGGKGPLAPWTSDPLERDRDPRLQEADDLLDPVLSTSP